MKEPKDMLWFYKSLPPVQVDPLMQEFVTMVPVSDRDRQSIYLRDHIVLHLASEPFDTFEEARHFAQAFVKHNYGEALIRTDGQKYIVYGDALNYIVRSAYRWDTGGFTFCNWA